MPDARRARAPAPGKVAQPTPAGHARSSPSRAAPPHAYDPLGDDEEHYDEASRVVDRDDGTAWTTESYQAGIEGAGKKGVGIYIDAKPKVEAVSMQIETPQPGFKVDDLRRPAGPGAQVRPRGLDEGRRRHGQRAKDKRFKLDTGGTAYRYYLVWITKLAEGRHSGAPRSPRSGSSRKSRLGRPRDARSVQSRSLSEVAARSLRSALGLEALERQREQPVAQRRERRRRSAPRASGRRSSS